MVYIQGTELVSISLIPRDSERTARKRALERGCTVYFVRKTCNRVMEILDKVTVQTKVQILEISRHDKGTESRPFF